MKAQDFKIPMRYGSVLGSLQALALTDNLPNTAMKSICRAIKDYDFGDLSNPEKELIGVLEEKLNLLNNE